MATFRLIENPLVTHEDFKLFSGPFEYLYIPSFGDPSKLRRQVFPITCKGNLETIKELEMFEDDIFILGHPKSGTTWTQEMVWLIHNDLNFELAKQIKITKRFGYLE